MNAFKKKCITLRKQDYTLGEIALETGRPKGSVYFHIKDIPLSDRKRRSIRERARKRAHRNARLRKGKSTRTFASFTSWNPELVSLIAHLLFDGEIMAMRCVYSNRNARLVQDVERAMGGIYAYEPKRHIQTLSGVQRISYHNVALAAYLHSKSRELVRDVTTLDQECQRTFLRAFFDDEGCMDVRLSIHVRRVRGYQKSRDILLLIQKLLNGFGMEAVLRGGNEIVLNGKANLLQFQKEINFSTGVCVNGGRANSIWKKSLEKRQLLAYALSSFRS